MSLVYAILAVGQNGEFGNDDPNAKGLPFASTSDMRWFKDFTAGQKIIMGKPTHDLVGKLPGRDIFINSRSGIDGPNGMSINLGCSPFDVVIAGGARTYAQHLLKTDFVFITIVDKVVGQATAHFDIGIYRRAGFEVIYSGSSKTDRVDDVNNLIILRNPNSANFTEGVKNVLANEIKQKVSKHFEPYLKLKVKNRITIKPGAHGLVEISTSVHVPVNQTGILSLRKSLAQQGLYTSGIIFRQGWTGKPTIIVTNHSGSLVDLKEDEEIGEIAFLNNQCL